MYYRQIYQLIPIKIRYGHKSNSKFQWLLKLKKKKLMKQLFTWIKWWEMNVNAELRDCQVFNLSFWDIFSKAIWWSRLDKWLVFRQRAESNFPCYALSDILNYFVPASQFQEKLDASEFTRALIDVHFTFQKYCSFDLIIISFNERG